MSLESLLAQCPAPWKVETVAHAYPCQGAWCELHCIEDRDGRPLGSRLPLWLAQRAVHLPALIAALQFYANRKHYDEHRVGEWTGGSWAGPDYVDPDFEYDDGERARAVLKLLEPRTGRRVVP
jgi:hypothetical protein